MGNTRLDPVLLDFTGFSWGLKVIRPRFVCASRVRRGISAVAVQTKGIQILRPPGHHRWIDGLSGLPAAEKQSINTADGS